MCIASEKETFSCSALLHSAAELESASHTCDLECREDGKHPIHCSVDHRLMGVGGDVRYVCVITVASFVTPILSHKTLCLACF